MREVVSRSDRLEGVISLPGDKSISHRALLLNSLAPGESHVSNLCHGDDRSSMLRCLRGLGVKILKHQSCGITGGNECYKIIGNGLYGLSEPLTLLNAGNSGTTLRLIAGLLAGQQFFSVISGDSSLRSRPMRRITEPLTEMGAIISGRKNNSLAPLAIRGGNLSGIVHDSNKSSAQVKSAVLIAGLYAQGSTTVRQPSVSRDHTEKMMESMGASLHISGSSVEIKPSKLQPVNVKVPSDTSGAAFWLIAGICHPNARITLPGVGLNPTRTGVLEVLTKMGASINIENYKIEAGEPSGDIVVESSELRGVEISGDIIPRVIDELPILSLAACFAKGRTVIKDANELRVKESDRISATVNGLSRLGAKISELCDGMEIHGGNSLTGTECESFGDHRIAMTLGVAGLIAKGSTVINGSEAAAVSYPEFWDIVKSLSASQNSR